MHTRFKELIEYHLIGEYAPFSFSLKDGGEEAPYVYVSSLWDKVQAMLNQHERYNLLLLWTRHNIVFFLWKGTRVSSGMMAKFLRMRSGWRLGVTKVAAHSKWCSRSSTRRLPTPRATLVFSIFEAPDNVTNLKVIGDRFRQHIDDLENGSDVLTLFLGTTKWLNLIHTHSVNKSRCSSVGIMNLWHGHMVYLELVVSQHYECICTHLQFEIC